MSKLLKLCIIIFFPILLILKCATNPADAAKDIVFPASKVSYSQHVQPLFNVRCAFSGCHDEAPVNTRLSLISYFAATQYPGIIVAGLPDNSVLILRLNGRLIPRMPTSRDTLTTNQYNGLRTWIKEGALPN